MTNTVRIEEGLAPRTAITDDRSSLESRAGGPLLDAHPSQVGARSQQVAQAAATDRAPGAPHHSHHDPEGTT